MARRPAPPKHVDASEATREAAAQMPVFQALIAEDADGNRIALTPEFLTAANLLREDFADGHRRVFLLAEDETLTTQEAADRLGMSRQFLYRLLDDGTIPSEPVAPGSTHRRVRVADVLDFEDRRRRGADLRREITAVNEADEIPYS